ncbi:uncharacterized protein KIAA2012 homolog [Channa argus]|uniref:uncharacterized protein KIAA2012 homolog n=1 Tax=Channa argus TaxID=215402 RepID=UPI0035228C46
MKDLSLSLLSRGWGRSISSSNRNTGRHDGRLDVCYTPRDYYIWQSKETLLRLSSSGHLFAEAESSLPKTYSTRRGALLLYSQDLAAMEINSGLQTGHRKKRVVQRDTQQAQQQLRTLKELTAAILSFSNNQYISSRLAAPLFRPLNLFPGSKLRCPSPQSSHATRPQPSSELRAQLSQQWLPTERNPELEKQPKDKEEEQDNRKRVRLDLFLQMPGTPRNTTPQEEPQPWVHYVAMTPKEPEEPQTYIDNSLQHSGTNSAGGEIHHPNMKSVHDAAEDQGSFVQDSGTVGRLCKTEQQSNTELETNTTSGLLPHPLNAHSSVCPRPYWEKKDRRRRESPSRDTQRLPPIAETHNAPPRQPIHVHTQQDVHQQPLILPPLFPEKEEVKEKQSAGREKTKRQYSTRDSVGQRGGKGSKLSEKSSAILLEPEEEAPPPVGLLGCVAGWKGPGKQSSLAFLHNLQDPCESTDTNRGLVRGVLPLELRDLQNKKSAGSLILGPDGEIIQLSLYDSSQDPSQGDGDTQQKALQVLSTEGEELPWVIVLQPEHTNTEGGVELNTGAPADDTQHHQKVFQGAEGHMPVRQVAAEELSFSPKQHVDLHRSTETNARSLHTGPMTKKKRKSTAAVTETWKEVKKGAKNKVRMPPLKERVGKGKLRKVNTEEEEDEEEEGEELGSTEENGYLYGSHGSSEIISPTDSTRRDTVDKKRKDTKRKAAEQAVITAGKRDVRGAESDGQNTVRRTEKGQRQKPRSGDAQSIGSETGEEQTTGEAAETQDQTALSSVKKKKKKVKDREGGRGEVSANEDREEPGGETAEQEEASSRRKRRRRQKHKELLAGSPEDPIEKDGLENNPGMQQEPHQKSTRRPSATQKYSDNTTAKDDTDTDGVSTSDKYSSIRSLSSHRSTVSSSHFNPRNSRRSATSSCEGAVSAGVVSLAASRGRLSSCSTVMITEEQLMLNPVKPEFSRPTKSQEEEEAEALRRAQRAERRRLEEERKKREQEEEERMKQEREQTEDRMKSELEEERRKRAEKLRLKKLAEEEERRRREEKEQERARQEQAQRERERRRQEERRRQMEQLRKMMEEEEQRRKDELERLRLEQEKQQEEESRMLQEMDESERIEYVCRKKQEQEERRLKDEEQNKREEEAAVEARLQAELLNRQMVLLQQQLAFKRGLVLEAGGLEKTQGISRPWVYSYFPLLQLLGLNPSKAETVTP